MEEIKILLSWRERLYRSIRSFKKGSCSEVRKGLLDKSSSSHSATELDDLRSTSLFSTSTELKSTIGHLTKKQSRVSLRDYIENDDPLPRCIQLGEISTKDSNVSVESSFLAVSFDDDYPQLVLQASTDASAPGSHLLGAAFPHPARKMDHKLRHASSPTKGWTMSPSPAPWSNGKASRLWDRIDMEATDSLLGGKSLESPMPVRPSPIQIQTQLADWEDAEDSDEMRWSFDDSVVTFSSVLNVPALNHVDCPFDEHD